MSFIKKNVKIIALCLAVVALLGVIIGGAYYLTRKANEDNLIYQLYDSDSSYVDKGGKDGNGIEWTIKDDGSVVADGEATANTYFELGSITFDAGTYTFTANEDCDKNEYYVVGLVDGAEVWYSDITNSENGMTHTFGAETTVTFRIVILDGAELNNVKFFPCVVEGKVAGEYFA